MWYRVTVMRGGKVLAEGPGAVRVRSDSPREACLRVVSECELQLQPTDVWVVEQLPKGELPFQAEQVPCLIVSAGDDNVDLAA
jgi:hypothetical protein